MNKRTAPDSIKEMWFSISPAFKKTDFLGKTRGCNFDVKKSQSKSDMGTILSKKCFDLLQLFY